jgi:hypothetical protein
LLLIDHEDFQELDHGYKERIAPTELVQQLIDMGLLAHQQPESIHIEEEVTSEENNTSTKSHTFNQIKIKTYLIQQKILKQKLLP